MSQGGAGVDDVVCHLKCSLLGDALGRTEVLATFIGDVHWRRAGQVQQLEDVLEHSQDLKRHTQPGSDVSIMSISKRSGLRLLCERASP
jgi:hypothetical protein